MPEWIKAALAAFLAAAGFFHLFAPSLSKWLADDAHAHKRGRRRSHAQTQAQNDPLRNVSIDPH
jgi:hypothetical protein